MKVDIYTTIVNGDKTDNTTPHTIAQQILNSSYTSPVGTQVPSPVTKSSMSKNKGRYNLFTNKYTAYALLEYTTILLEIIPRWLKGNENYSRERILANTTAATPYTRAQPMNTPTKIPAGPTNKPTQIPPAHPLTMPTSQHTHQNPNTTSLTQHSKINETEITNTQLLSAIKQLADQINTLRAKVDWQSGIITQLLQDSKTAATRASTLPSQLQSAISGVDSLITTACELHKAYKHIEHRPE